MWSSMHSFCPLTETVILTIQPVLPMVLAVHICKLSSYELSCCMSLWSHCNCMQGFNSSSCVLVYRHFKEPFRKVTRALCIILSWRHFLIYVHKLGGPFLSWLLAVRSLLSTSPWSLCLPTQPPASSVFISFPSLSFFRAPLDKFSSNCLEILLHTKNKIKPVARSEYMLKKAAWKFYTRT